MTLAIPNSTRNILDAVETAHQPLVEYELSSRLCGLHQADGLSDAERKGAWAEAAAFNFTPAKESPWETYYGPVFAASKHDGTPY